MPRSSTFFGCGVVAAALWLGLGCSHAQDASDAPVPSGIEVVMAPGSTLVALTPTGQIQVGAGKGLQRCHTIFYSHYACSPCVSAFNQRLSPCNDNVCLKVIDPDYVYHVIINILFKGNAKVPVHRLFSPPQSQWSMGL
jgi:hypothetical protein